MVLCVNNIASFQNGPKDLYLRNLITELGQTANLSICIDAADPRSYAGTGQTISDRSGGGNDFFVGTTGSVESGVDVGWNAGPTNNNGAGVADENTYFTSSLGNKIANVTNGAPASTNWFRNNGVVSAIAAIFIPNSAFGQICFSTGDSTSAKCGFFSCTDTTPLMSYYRTDATNDTVFSTFTSTKGSWNIFGFAFDEAAGTIAFTLNSSSETKSGILSTATVGITNQNYVGHATAGSVGTARVGCVAVWNRALSTAELLSFYTQLKARRFPSVP